MRPIERIPIYINLLRNKKIGEKINLNSIFEFDFGEDYINEDVIIYFSANDLNKLEKFWKDNPDLRFTQLVINTGIIPNFPGFWYYKEDGEIMLKFGFEPREVLFWGTYGINGDQPLSYKLLKNMSTDHIEAVVKNVEKISDEYKKAFIDELEYRKTFAML